MPEACAAVRAQWRTAPGSHSMRMFMTAALVTACATMAGCRYFERHPESMELVDDEGVPWNPQAVVREQVAKVRSSQPAPMFGCTALQRDVTSPRARFASLQMENSYGRILLRVKVTRPPEDIIEPTFSAVRSTPTSAGGAMPGLDDGEEDAATLAVRL